MTQPAKFNFGKEFGEKGPNSAKAIEQEVANLRAEVPQAEARGFEAGRNAANTQLNQTLTMLANSAKALLDVLEQERAAMKEEAIQLSLLTARTLAGHVLDRAPAEAVREFAAACVDSLRKCPHIVFRVHPDIVEGVEAELKKLSFERGLEGRLIVLGDPDKMQGDCKIEWADGGFERNRAHVEREIADAVARYLNEKTQNPVTTEETHG